jgi:hypothetical protein
MMRAREGGKDEGGRREVSRRVSLYLYSCSYTYICQGARRDYEAELRNTFGRGGHRGCSPSSSSSSSSSANGGGGGGGGARGGTRRGNSQHQPWYQSSDGVSYKEAAAFFAAAFAAEVSEWGVVVIGDCFTAVSLRGGVIIGFVG